MPYEMMKKACLCLVVLLSVDFVVAEGSNPIGGKWITAQSGQGNYRPALRLFKEFVVGQDVRRATLKATALGLYVPFVNGKEITDRRLMPGWTQYEYRVPSQTFDVTRQIVPGTNVLAALVGDGWYCGQISYVGQPIGKAGWGRHPRFRAELVIEHADGSVRSIATDRTWRSYYGTAGTLWNDVYQGEEYDAFKEDESWKLPGFANVNSVSEVSEKTEIVGDIGQPVVVTRELKPVKITRRPSGTWLLDFGENIGGVDRIRLKKPHPGAVIVIRHGEDLDADGNLWRDNLSFAGAKTVLNCGPKAPFEYSPRFTFFGYRYAEISGWPADEELSSDSVNALVLSAAVKPTGSFACSNELLNRLYANVRRSQQANFIDVPTDCPQRCERFGWTGDAQIFAETAMMNYDVQRFFVKWLGDVRLCRDASGAFPSIAPWPPQGFDTSKSTGSAGWADIGVVGPWMLYRKYGNRDALREAYPSIVKYVDLLASAEKLGTIGDHLNLDQPTSPAYLAEALRIEMHRLAALAARALRETEDEKRFLVRREQLLAQFRAKHLGADGLPKERTQTAAAFSIAYGIAPDDKAQRATVGLLKELIVERGGHLATGFLGTPVLLRALTEAGGLDAAYRLLETETFPGWLYPVTQDATTIWERWDAKVDGKYNPSWMNSLNHYAYGSVVAWFYDTIAGIRDLTEENPEWAGFRRFRLAPRPGGTLTHAKATHEIPGGGVISSAWELKDGRVEWTFDVPAGTEAEIVLPGKLVGALPEGVAVKGNLLLAKPGHYVLVCERGHVLCASRSGTTSSALAALESKEPCLSLRGNTTAADFGIISVFISGS